MECKEENGVPQLKCECKTLHEWNISTSKELDETKSYFRTRTQSGLYTEVSVTEPYYSWRTEKEYRKWFADKWYVCNSCGCLWEVVYPEFPAKGFVRKFSDEIYHERGY